MTFSKAVRAAVVERAGNRCERCGRALLSWPFSLHHRRPRGMGGSHRPDTDSVANALALCGSGTTGCHGWVESNRDEARRLGFLVASHDDPQFVPVALHLSRWVALHHDGTYRDAP
jgi:hypothetical protein